MQLILLLCAKQDDIKWLPCPVGWRTMYAMCMEFTADGFCTYCRDLKERIHLFCGSDAQPCRMTHNDTNGTDVNRRRAQVSLTCTRSANGVPHFLPRLQSLCFHWSSAASIWRKSEAQFRNYTAEQRRVGEMINLSKANLCSGWDHSDIQPTGTKPTGENN